jgi:hypothetical protein
MLENAVRICGTTFGNIYQWQGKALHLVIAYDKPPDFLEYRKRTPLRADPKVLLAAWWRPSQSFTLPILRQGRRTLQAIQYTLQELSLAVCGHSQRFLC